MITRFVKVATPETAATVVVPESVPVPLEIETTTLAVEVVTVFPPASIMRITGCVPRTDPLGAPCGSVVIARAVALPTAVAGNTAVITPEFAL